MFLGDYFQNIQSTYKKFFFSGISFNSSEIKKNNIFFAIKGNKVDGNNFISSAISNGAKIVVTEKKINGLKNGILFIHSNNIRKLLAEISFKINNKIPNNIIAVTGTNGKSSIADFYYQILDLNNKKVASIGTLGIKTRKYKKNLSNTTIDPIQLSKILIKLKKQNINNVIMEASSHGLSQNRLDGLLFDTGIKFGNSQINGQEINFNFVQTWNTDIEEAIIGNFLTLTLAGVDLINNEQKKGYPKVEEGITYDFNGSDIKSTKITWYVDDKYAKLDQTVISFSLARVGSSTPQIQINVADILIEGTGNTEDEGILGLPGFELVSVISALFAISFFRRKV